MRTVSTSTGLRRAAVVTAAASALVLGTAAAAVAGPPWTVLIGGDATGDAVTYSADAAPVSFAVSGLDLACESSTATADIVPGPTAGVAGGISGTTFDGCLGPLDIPMEVATTGVWDLVVTGDNVGGVTPGSITDVQATASNADGLCSFEVAGTANGAFDENTQTLAVTGPSELVVSDVQGCFGLITEGDNAEFLADYVVSGGAPITIEN